MRFEKLAVMSTFILAALSACGGYSGSLTSGAVTSAQEISSWAYVDSATIDGINKNVTQTANSPQLTIFGSKLYATWQEHNGTAYQIRMAVYNGNDASPSWAFVDGGGTNGINKNSAQSAYAPQLTVLGTKLYATWSESNGTASQIRVAVYSGNDGAPSWTFVDVYGTNGINKDVAKTAGSSKLTVLGTKLYATWSESNGTSNQIRMAVYNGNDAAPSWTFVDGNGTNGINKDVTQTAYFPQLTVLGSKLYATWQEAKGTTSQIRTAVYNGNDVSPSWASVDGTNGINKDATQFAGGPQLTALSTKLYATWYESNGTATQIRTAVYNGNDASPSWTFVEGNGTNGINNNVAKDAGSSQLTVLGSKLYATWAESTIGTAYQIRTAVYNGNDASPSWAFVDGNGTNGINNNVAKAAAAPQLTVLGSKLYATWFEDNGTANQIRVAVGQ